MVEARPASGTAYTLRANGATAEIAGVGASLRSLAVDGRDLIVPFAADEARPAFRGALLAPWPNRVVDGRYRYRDRDHQLPITEVGRGHALHGLVAWQEFDEVSEPSSRRLALATEIAPRDGYPWRVRVETEFELEGRGIRQTVRGTNLSADPAPWGTGPHPYLVAPRGVLDEWTLELPAARVLEVGEDRLEPRTLSEVSGAAAARFDFRRARRIGGTRLDHAFTGLERDDAGDAVVRLTGADGRGAEVRWDRACPWVQVHTADLPHDPNTRLGLAVEPMTCAPDAFNASRYPFDTGLRSIEPGETIVVSWWIGAIR
ncbi:aldose 1-epimerase family protein [Leucobacter sp. wl10]|uniref:aldose 1-epimerase family protein n=1 Tax=Leucobacter sp. wl10 TaxID=2304677 RepID=UPI00352A7FDD